MKLTHRPEWLILGIVCIAANLRAPITGLPALIGAIQADLDLSSTVAGLLTTTPLSDLRVKPCRLGQGWIARTA